MKSAAAAALALIGGTAVAANVTVVRSGGASARNYPPGTSLPDTATLRLGAGDMVMVLGARGTRTFRGPGSFRVNAPVQAQTMAQAIGRANVRSRVGAVRGSPAPRSMDVWNVDISRSGTVCLLDTSRATLWRRAADRPASVTLSSSDSSPVTVEFGAGRATGAWPAALPIRSGADYRIGSGANPPVTVRLISVQPVPSDAQETAILLIRNGCQAQLERLLAAAPEG